MDDGRWTMDDGNQPSAIPTPSSIVHRPSSIVHRPSSIVHRLPPGNRPSSADISARDVVQVVVELLELNVVHGVEYAPAGGAWGEVRAAARCAQHVHGHRHVAAST